MSARTLYDKIWDASTVCPLPRSGESLLYVDLHLIHEVTSPQAFAGLEANGRKLRCPDRTLAVADHNTPTICQEKGLDGVQDSEAREQLRMLSQNTSRHGVEFFPMGDRRNGIVHVVAPEQGRSWPGMVIVCGDSHTSTHGAFGALAHGIGTSEVEHVLSTQTLRCRKMKNMRVSVEGELSPGVSAKDVALHVISCFGTAAGTGHVIEFAGSAIKSLSMEGRMTLCNMSIEAGARAGLIAPDRVTFEYIRGRPGAPAEESWEDACSYWRTLFSDSDAFWDSSFSVYAADIQPMISWGTSPEQAVAISGSVPDPESMEDPIKRQAAIRAISYMGLEPGQKMEGLKLDRVFIGSCTNSRIEDLRIAAEVASKGRVSSDVRAMVVPGSGLVREQAEREGLDRIFIESGFEWRQPGCSMCLGMNPDILHPKERCASTSNRNFEGRQGRQGRTHLLSPELAALSALSGKVSCLK